MWTLIKTIYDSLDQTRKEAKLSLTVLVWDLLLLIIVMMATAACVKEVMHPAISIIGFAWILLSVATIWHLGGVIVDSLFLAKLLDTEVGKEFTRAFNIFFILGSTTVIFFFLIPVWKFWAGTILLPVLLVAIFACANMAERKTNWDLFFRIFASIAGAILAAIVIAGLTGWTTENGAAFIQRTWFKSWIERLLLLGLLFLGISFIPKMPQKALQLGAGLAIIASIILLVFPEIQPNFNPNQPKKATKITEHKSPATAKISSLVATGITLEQGERLLATKDASAPPVVLVIKFPDGEQRELDASFWGKKSLTFSHTGSLAQRPIEVFYEGAKGNYHFQKLSSANSVHATPAGERTPCPLS